MTTATLVLEYVKALIWPVMALAVLIAYRGPIMSLFSGSRITLTLFGITVETTVPQLQEATLQMISGPLTPEQAALLALLARSPGTVSVDDDAVGQVTRTKEGRRCLWPLRNAGLVMTLPVDEHLSDATHLALTPIGRLLMQSRVGASNA